MNRLVDIDTTWLEAHRIGALPVVNRFFARLGLKHLFEGYVPGDPRARLAYSDVLLVLLQSLVSVVRRSTRSASGSPVGRRTCSGS